MLLPDDLDLLLKTLYLDIFHLQVFLMALVEGLHFENLLKQVIVVVKELIYLQLLPLIIISKFSLFLHQLLLITRQLTQLLLNKLHIYLCRLPVLFFSLRYHLSLVLIGFSFFNEGVDRALHVLNLRIDSPVSLRQHLILLLQCLKLNAELLILIHELVIELLAQHVFLRLLLVLGLGLIELFFEKYDLFT